MWWKTLHVTSYSLVLRTPCSTQIPRLLKIFSNGQAFQFDETRLPFWNLRLWWSSTHRLENAFTLSNQKYSCTRGQWASTIANTSHAVYLSHGWTWFDETLSALLNLHLLLDQCNSTFLNTISNELKFSTEKKERKYGILSVEPPQSRNIQGVKWRKYPIRSWLLSCIFASLILRWFNPIFLLLSLVNLSHHCRGCHDFLFYGQIWSLKFRQIPDKHNGGLHLVLDYTNSIIFRNLTFCAISLKLNHCEHRQEPGRASLYQLSYVLRSGAEPGLWSCSWPWSLNYPTPSIRATDFIRFSSTTIRCMQTVFGRYLISKV